jgi:N6-L-threonylcarbamoyladenine synthase
LLILAIDTSCDETSVAISRDDCILSNVIYSQVEIHKKWGGVVPNLARINHQEKLPQVIEQALKRAKLKIEEIDVVAVTVGPGLAIALEVGIRTAKEICEKYHKKFIAINHMEGHLLSPFIKGESKLRVDLVGLRYPGIGLLVSGGHTQLVRVEEIGKYKIIGDTLDDAAGEAFDKVAKMLELGYPGGPIVAKLAEEGRPIYKLPVPMLKSHDLNFSFSGLKTAALYFLRNFKGEKNHQFICDFCASFEFAVVDSIRRKLEKSLKLFPAEFILCGGGVMNNLALRKMVRRVAKNHAIPAFFPVKKMFNSDNAAMIAVAGFYRAKRGEFMTDLNLVDRKPNWEIDQKYN